LRVEAKNFGEFGSGLAVEWSEPGAQTQVRLSRFGNRFDLPIDVRLRFAGFLRIARPAIEARPGETDRTLPDLREPGGGMLLLQHPPSRFF